MVQDFPRHAHSRGGTQGGDGGQRPRGAQAGVSPGAGAPGPLPERRALHPSAPHLPGVSAREVPTEISCVVVLQLPGLRALGAEGVPPRGDLGSGARLPGILALPLSSCVTLGKALLFPGPPFPHLCNPGCWD